MLCRHFWTIYAGERTGLMNSSLLCETVKKKNWLMRWAIFMTVSGGSQVRACLLVFKVWVKSKWTKFTLLAHIALLEVDNDPCRLILRERKKVCLVIFNPNLRICLCSGIVFLFWWRHFERLRFLTGLVYSKNKIMLLIT